MEDQSWKAYFPSTPPQPSLIKIITDLQRRVLESPIFVCLICTKESNSQQAMAAHCKQHVCEGMAKGTVQHIKYYPDHTRCEFLCMNPPPTPRDSGSLNRIKKVPLPSYKTVFAYAGGAFMSHLESIIPGNPNGARPNIDLTLRLGPTPGTAFDDDYQGMKFSLPGSSGSTNDFCSGGDPKGKMVMRGPWN